jgi:hypothetical protein
MGCYGGPGNGGNFVMGCCGGGILAAARPIPAMTQVISERSTEAGLSDSIFLSG